MLTSTGATIEHEIDVAVETPEADAGFFGLMALLGTYVGVIPVALGMLFLPFLRRVGDELDPAADGVHDRAARRSSPSTAPSRGSRSASASNGAFGGVELLFLGAAARLPRADRRSTAWLRGGRSSGSAVRAPARFRLALMVAIGIGLHNLGEGLAIGSAYAVGALALGAFLVVGFAIHNTTEGLAIVAPLARAERPSLARLAGARPDRRARRRSSGAVIGASAYNPELAAFLIGVGVGAIVQVIVQLLPVDPRRRGPARCTRRASPGSSPGPGSLYATSLLVSV